MGQMTHCTACQRHYFASEALCPHCGADRPAFSPVRRFVRQAKMGGLMLFTALTTTACYGTPPMTDGPPGTLPPGYERPLPQVPASPGLAYVFATREGEPTASAAKPLRPATLTANRLVISGLDTAIAIETTGDVFVPAEGTREAVSVEQMRSLSVNARPGAELLMFDKAKGGLEGTLQISRLDDEAISGVLRLQQNGTALELYFHAAR